jgi:hypothetical protein
MDCKSRGSRSVGPMLVPLALMLLALVPFVHAEPEPKPAHRLHHYVFFNRDRERISEASFLNTPALEGAQLKYTWRQLEPRPGEYDFADIEHDLAFLTSKHKRLFIQVQDISYDSSIINVPRYLPDDPRYHGGVARQYEIQGDDEQHAKPQGWVARRWDPAVQERFAMLLLALGKQFDGKIEGINLPETSIDFGETGRLYPEGFTPLAYRDAVIANLRTLKRAFPKSVTMQYANFMIGGPDGQERGSYLRDVFAAAAELKVGLGGPDLMPYRPMQMRNSYPLLREVTGRVPTGIAVQDGNYQTINPKAGKQVTVPELIDFASSYLKVDYVFWCTQLPYYERDVIPYLRPHP